LAAYSAAASPIRTATKSKPKALRFFMDVSVSSSKESVQGR